MSTQTRSTAEQLVALRRVQRRVAAIAFFAIAIHGVIGLVVVAEVVHGQGRTADAVLLLAMSAVFGVVTYVVTRIILGARVLSPWLALAFVPAVVGIFWVF